MARRLAIALSAVFALTLALALGGCAAEKKAETSEPEKSSETSVETSAYEGSLVMALQNEIVLSGSEGDMEFVTGEDTKYNMGDSNTMYLDDIVSVAYHVDGDAKHADEITLVEHMDTALSFAGTLVDSDKDFITLAAKELTVTFQIDSDSYIVGDLSKGDEIELTYLGDINEYPYANVVAVVTEVTPPATHVVRGVVSELAGGTLLLGIDSAHAYRFVITDSTEVGGIANDVTVGDRVDITYEGSIWNQPNALSIKVVERAPQRAYVINGKIAGVGNDYVTLDTGMARYSFGTNSSTKFYGEKPADGYRAEITYTGNLSENPQATIVYCVKDEKSANKATAKKKESKSNAKPSSSSAKKDDSKKASNSDKASTQKTEPKSEAAPKTEPSKSEAVEPQPEPSSGASPEPSSEAASEPEPDSDEAPEPEPDNTKRGSVPDPNPDEGTEPEPGPNPEGGTEPEPGPNPDEGTEPQPEPTPDEGTEPQPEPTPDEGTEPEPEPEADEATDPEPEPEVTVESEPEPEAEMGVSGKGTIVSDNGQKLVIKINGKKVTLKYDGSTNVSSGYIPQEGDVVKVEYGSSSMTLRDVQLVDRSADSEDD